MKWTMWPRKTIAWTFKELTNIYKNNSNKVPVEGSPICIAMNQICKNCILTGQQVKHLINYLYQTLTDLDETRNNVMQATLW